VKKGILIALLVKGLVEAIAIGVWLMTGVAHGETLVQCPSETQCSIAVYSSADSTQMITHTIELVVPKDSDGNPTPITGTSVNFLFDGQQYTVTCDGEQHGLGSSSCSELANMISCTVDQSGTTPGTRVTVDLILHDQDTYSHAYSDCPGYTDDSTLEDTDENSPYCVEDSDHSASACKWEKQNVNDSLLTQRGVPLNDWVIYARTTVDNMDMGFPVEPPPPYPDSELVCSEDLNGNGQIDEGEIQECVTTPQGDLCPVDATPCTTDEKDPTCPDGSTYNPGTDRCEIDTTCPSGFTKSGSLCVADPNCPDGSTYNPDTDRCEINASCPSGYTLSGSLCVVDPICPSGSTYNPSTDRCEMNATATTNTCYTVSGWLAGWPGWPDSHWQDCHGSCPSSPQCSNNTQPSGSARIGYKNTDPLWVSNAAFHHEYDWYQWTTYSCPSGYTLSGTLCVADPNCPDGSTYNPDTDRCEVNATCPSGYTLSGSLCEVDPTCPSGSTFNPDTDRCEIDTTCPSDYEKDGDICFTDASCPTGYTFYGGDKDKCVSDTPNVCPYGSQYTCMNNGGTWECSKNECTQYGSSDQEDTDTPQGATDKQDDGLRDDDGNCLGQIYIFNGHDKRCRNASMYTSWTNCCFTGSYENCERKNWLGVEICNSDEQALACQKRKGLCHYVGDYCAKKMSVGLGKVCTQRKKTYCCFSSKLGRIIQEQGRLQLKSFDPNAPWGLPTAPNCRGFTPEEFQMLDFGKIDLSEWYGDIKTRSQGEIQNEAVTKTHQFYNKFTGGQ